MGGGAPVELGWLTGLGASGRLDARGGCGGTGCDRRGSCGSSGMVMGRRLGAGTGPKSAGTAGVWVLTAASGEGSVTFLVLRAFGKTPPPPWHDLARVHVQSVGLEDVQGVLDVLEWWVHRHLAPKVRLRGPPQAPPLPPLPFAPRVQQFVVILHFAWLPNIKCVILIFAGCHSLVLFSQKASILGICVPLWMACFFLNGGLQCVPNCGCFFLFSIL